MSSIVINIYHRNKPVDLIGCSFNIWCLSYRWLGSRHVGVLVVFNHKSRILTWQSHILILMYQMYRHNEPYKTAIKVLHLKMFTVIM